LRTTMVLARAASDRYDRAMAVASRRELHTPSPDAPADGAMNQRIDTHVARIAAEWYAVNSDVRRLWVYETGETGADQGSALHVVVALAPVVDSDDISPIWLARCAAWQRDLQARIGRRVRLDWLDEDFEAPPCAMPNDRSQVCLATVAWRDGGDEAQA